jgi:anti-anti-sigma regulatory factor
MSLELIIFALASFISVGAIFFCIWNLFLIFSFSSKISTIEQEIEKKTMEFDTIKKEKNNLSLKNNDYNSNFGEKLEQNQDYVEPVILAEKKEPQIEVFRNVLEHRIEPDNISNDKSQISASKDMGSSLAQDMPMHFMREQVYAANENNKLQFKKEDIKSEEQSEILDVIKEDDNNKILEENTKHNSIYITLFSNSKKDTDFVSAWQILSNKLITTKKPEVIFDFSNVMFLYDKELTYLEKFCDTILKAEGSISFVNCHPELIPFIQSRPILASYLKSE